MAVTAVSEQFKIAACNVVRFLTLKTLSALFYNVTPNVNMEFLKIAMSEPIVSTKQGCHEVFSDSHLKNFQ